MRAREDARPPRPHLPPLLIAGLAMWGAAAAVWPALSGASSAALAAAGAGSLGAAALLAVLCLRRGRAAVGAVAALGVLVAVGACAAGAAGVQAAGRAMAAASGPWECTLTTDAKPSEFGWRAEARVRLPQGREASVRLNLPEGAEGLLQGDAVVVDGSFSAPRAASREYYWSAGLAGSLTADFWEAHDAAPGIGSLRRRALEVIGEHGGRSAALLQALVCGWRPAIEAEGAYDRFKTVGLAHLVAVSGAHLSIVTLFVAQLLRAARASRRVTAVATALFLAGYVGFTGMPVSALRAALMASAGLLALVVDRRSSALGALGLCLVAFVGADPPCALSASFALSAGSTLGIVLLAPLFSSAAARWPRKARAAVAEPLALTAASSAATQPYAAALFSQVPLLSPVANLLAAPLFSLACVVGFAAVGAACLVPPCAPAAVGFAACAAAPLGAVVDLLSRVPASCLPADVEAVPMVALSAAVVGGLWAWWPRLDARAVAGVLVAAALLPAALLIAPARAADEIVMLDVGQGDAFLLRSQGSTLLIDTGNQDDLLKEACARQGVRRVGWVAVTHPDDDHCGSLAALGDVAAVGGLIVARDLLSCSCDACTGLLSEASGEGYPSGVRGLAVGDEVSCGRFTLRVVWPEAFADEGGNADSLSFLCEWDGDGDGAAEWTALFCGDAEAEELRAMAPALPAAGVDVLKVGHHGSKKSLDADLARALRPSVALIGVGESNRYGHPAPAVVQALADVGAEVLCSDEAGDVSVAFSMEKLTVRSQSEPNAP